MIMLELDGEFATAEVDMGPPGRPPLVQPRVDTDNFPDRPLARIGTRTRREPHPQRVPEVLSAAYPQPPHLAAARRLPARLDKHLVDFAELERFALLQIKAPAPPARGLRAALQRLPRPSRDHDRPHPAPRC
jgi:hypothetical protein